MSLPKLKYDIRAYLAYYALLFVIYVMLVFILITCFALSVFIELPLFTRLCLISVCSVLGFASSYALYNVLFYTTDPREKDKYLSYLNDYLNKNRS